MFYALVSGVASGITQVLLVVLHSFVGWRASFANIGAVAVATPVSYFMNRAWVWKKRGKSHLAKEVAPFWAFSLGGMVLSTVLVGVVATTQHVPLGVQPTLWQQLQLNLANVVGFGVLWLIQFFVLDKISFLPHPTATDEVDDNGAPVLDGAVPAPETVISK